jgi:hypothetical protein
MPDMPQSVGFDAYPHLAISINRRQARIPNDVRMWMSPSWLTHPSQSEVVAAIRVDIPDESSEHWGETWKEGYRYQK